MEHAVPESFWVDKTQCRYVDANGQVQNPLQAACVEGISAVKAIAIAQQQGQKIYTINKDNRATALPKLTIGGTTGAEIRAAINAGKEVTFHEKQINAHGWKGFGYIILDPETGAAAYLIEGGGNGGWFLVATVVLALLAAATYVVFGPFAVLGWGWFLLGSLGAAVHALDETNATVKWGFVWAAIGLGLGIISIPGLFALTAAAAWGVWGLAFYSAMITIYEFL